MLRGLSGCAQGEAGELFGVNFAWPQFFILTLVAHVFLGVALAPLVQHFLTEDDRGGLLEFLRGPVAG